MNRAQVFEFFRRLAEANPSPTTELEFVEPLPLLVAVVLSAQATDAERQHRHAAAVRAHQDARGRWSSSARTSCAMHIKTIGLFNTKAKNVIALSQALIDRHGGAGPAHRDELQALPGVGRKTANVVLNTAFGEETFAVDTHVFRVCNRTGLAPGKTVEQGRSEARKGGAAAIPPRRAPLADPARPLHLQGAPARMLALPGDRPVPLQAQDSAARRARQTQRRSKRWPSVVKSSYCESPDCAEADGRS